jgi:EpsI family protein
MDLKRSIVVSAIMVFTMVLTMFLGHARDIPPLKPFSTFPKQIEGWSGKDERFAERVYEKLGVDDTILANYRSADGREVQLYVGFYRRLDEGSGIHSPKNCMPGAGWNIIRSSVEELSIPSVPTGKMNAIKLLIEKSGRRQIVLYWFQSGGRYIASEYWQKIYMVMDSITKSRTDGAFVRLIAPVVDGNQERALQSLKDFVGAMIPVLQEYIPS